MNYEDLKNGKREIFINGIPPVTPVVYENTAKMAVCVFGFLEIYIFYVTTQM